MKENKIKNKGFTLIELLVVIAIIGILSSVVLGSLNAAREKARDVRRVTDIKQIQLALEIYYDINKSYPTDIYAAGILAPTYIPNVPTDPQGGHYSYAYSPTTGDPLYYHVGATLEGGGNSALSGDSDCDSSGTSCPAGVAYTDGFVGTDPMFDAAQ